MVFISVLECFYEVWRGRVVVSGADEESSESPDGLES